MASLMNLLVAGLLLVCATESNAATPACPGVATSLGCFPTGYPWFIPESRPMPPPQTPEKIDTQFDLFTRDKNATAFKIVKQPMSLKGSTFVGTKPTFFIIQGFMANPTIAWVTNLKNALLKEFDANVIIVDWSKGAPFNNYLLAASNTRIVAAEITRLIAYMVANSSASTTRMHLIGHSLGAHIAGYVGRALNATKIGLIARITALDAAQPGFEGIPAEVRLNSTDAVFVEAIHTNARPFVPFGGLGYIAQIGHVDFYVNGGALQPGCIDLGGQTITSITQLVNQPTEVILSGSVCSHMRAIYLFIASVLNKEYIMWGHNTTTPLLPPSATFPECTKATCSPLGLQTTNYPARGVFAVKTAGASPFFIKDATSDKIMEIFKIGPSATL